MLTLQNSDADADLAKMFTAGQMLQRRSRLFELEDPVDYGMHPADANRAVHVLEHLARTHPDTHDVRCTKEDAQRIDLTAHPGEQADHGDKTAGRNRLQRVRQRSGAADVQDMVGALAAGLFHDALIPIRGGLVVDHLGGAQVAQARDLVFAAVVAITRAPLKRANWSPKIETPPVP